MADQLKMITDNCKMQFSTSKTECVIVCGSNRSGIKIVRQ